MSLVSNFRTVATIVITELLSETHTGLYNTKQRNAQFYKVMFNLCFVLHVSNLVDSSSGRKFRMQYAMRYMHRCEQSGV